MSFIRKEYFILLLCLKSRKLMWKMPIPLGWGSHWTLCAWFRHLLSCSLIDLFNHWSHRSWEMTVEERRLVLAISLMGTTARWGRIILGHAYITSAYSKFGKSQSLLFLNDIQKCSNPGKTPTCSNLPQNVSNVDS